ncbi:GGDEF domain-containing protein [Geminocystis sp.]|uniref:GGDEF domain-containing protein n=1 Tax=Geminocystis sp. TaxID=2664100 RepID=UPI0035940434
MSKINCIFRLKKARGKGHETRSIDKIPSLNDIHEGSPFEYVNTSMGIVSKVPDNDDTPENLILKADKALYSAKHQGRNQFILHN